MSVILFAVSKLLIKFSVCLFVLGIINQNCIAADENVNKPAISFVGVEGELLSNVQKHVRLFDELQEQKVLSANVLQRLKKRVVIEIQQALEPFGYYQATVSEDLQAEPNQIVYRIELNQPIIIRSLSIMMDVAESHQQEFNNWQVNYPLKEGEVLLQQPYEGAKKTLQSTALRWGYFDAKFLTQEILINESRTSADIKLVFSSGERYSISSTSFEWKFNEDDDFKTRQLIDTSLLQSLVTITKSDFYDSNALVKTQQNLINTPYFSSVSVQAGDTDQSNSTVPVIISLTPKKRKAYSIEAGVGTDTGIRGGIGYENRRINAKGHNVSLRVGGSEIKRSVIANYKIPLKSSPKDNLNFFATLEEEIGDIRQFSQSSVGTELTQDWHGALLKYGLTASREKYIRLEDEDDLDSEVETSAELLMPSIEWAHTESDNLRNPSKGWSAAIKLQAASDSLGSSVSLAQTIVGAKLIYPLGSGLIKLRTSLGGTLINEANDIPESIGFLTGGDDSVRGYSYESIGVENGDDIEVGKNLVVASLEYQHPLDNSISVATFIDAGDAFNSNPSYKKGIGVGVRWNLPFGALRLDLASAIDREGNPLRLHFSFGTDL